MDLHNLISHLNYTEENSVRIVAGSLGCAILWSYAELFTPKVWGHMVWVDQAPMQNYALDGTWGADMANRGMNCEDAVRLLFSDFAAEPDRVHRGTIAACLSYRSHPLPTDKITRAQFEEDESFFLEQARRGDPTWYAQLMKDHTSLDWRDVLKTCFGGKKVLVVASSRSGCFPAKGVLEATRLVNQGGGEAEGVEVEWGGHWCYWEDPERFWGIVMLYLQ